MTNYCYVRLLLIEVVLLFRNWQSTAAAGTILTAHRDFGFEPIGPEIADELDWTKHSCRRNCRDGGPSMECYYTFKLEGYQTMSKACYNCPFNITDCFRMHCIPADGIQRSVLTVNRQIPGPLIEVCQGDRIIVDVINSLHSESTTMHWHGQHHVNTPYMDGVPYVSQCPISPGSSFRYDYVATEAGTHFWHSHSGFQRGDGVFGPLIVHLPPNRNPHRDFYHVDEHVIVIYDWTHQLGIDKFLSHHHTGGDNKPPNILVNGFGRFPTNQRGTNASALMPITTFTVKQNTRHRFRLVNAEFLNCPIKLSIDNHTMFIISSDGRDIEPIEAISLVSYAGERYDFVVEMNQSIDNYWIRFQGLMDCDERFTKAHQVAVLRYEGATEENPKALVSYRSNTSDSLGLRVNALNEGTETKKSVSVPLFKAMDENDRANTVQPDHQFYISYDFYKKNNAHFHRSNYYNFHQVKDTMRVLTPQLNHISMKLPSIPLLSQRDDIDSNGFCNASTVHGCEQDHCACTHVLRVRLGSVVELVLVDEGLAYDANHPFHLHGYQFRVIAMERVGRNVTVEQVQKLDKQGSIRRNLDHAPLKDTVTVPDGGYTIVRFHANNPGYWLFHCHIEFHAEVGMSLLFKVGEHEDMLPVPPDFPRCGDWLPSRVSYKKNSTLPDTVTDSSDANRMHEISNQTTENDVQEFFKLLPKVLRTLQISSSMKTFSALSYLVYFFCTIAIRAV